MKRCILRQFIPVKELVDLVLLGAYTAEFIKYVDVLTDNCDTDQPHKAEVAEVEQCVNVELFGELYDLGYRLHPSITRDKYYEWCSKQDCNVKSQSGMKFLEPLNIRPEMSHPLRQAHYIDLL